MLTIVAIATAVITLGRGLNLNVVAEGVETKAQLDCLRALQCEEMQGYYFSRPLSVNNVTKLLQNCALKSQSRWKVDQTDVFLSC